MSLQTCLIAPVSTHQSLWLLTMFTSVTIATKFSFFSSMILACPLELLAFRWWHSFTKWHFLPHAKQLTSFLLFLSISLSGLRCWFWLLRLCPFRPQGALLPAAFRSILVSVKFGFIYCSWVQSLTMKSSNFIYFLLCFKEVQKSFHEGGSLCMVLPTINYSSKFIPSDLTS